MPIRAVLRDQKRVKMISIGFVARSRRGFRHDVTRSLAAPFYSQSDRDLGRLSGGQLDKMGERYHPNE